MALSVGFNGQPRQDGRSRSYMGYTMRVQNVYCLEQPVTEIAAVEPQFIDPEAQDRAMQRVGDNGSMTLQAVGVSAEWLDHITR